MDIKHFYLYKKKITTSLLHHHFYVGRMLISWLLTSKWYFAATVLACYILMFTDGSDKLFCTVKGLFGLRHTLKCLQSCSDFILVDLKNLYKFPNFLFPLSYIMTDKSNVYKKGMFAKRLTCKNTKYENLHVILTKK